MVRHSLKKIEHLCLFPKFNFDMMLISRLNLKRIVNTTTQNNALRRYRECFMYA